MTSRPRVLRVITRLNIGGPGRQALLLTRCLAGRYPTTLVAGTPPTHEGELVDDRVPVVRAPLVRQPNPGKDLQAIRQVRSLIQRIRPAIVHTHTAKAGGVGRVAVRSLRSGPRTVHTYHGHVLEGYFSPHVERAYLLTERWLARQTDVLVAVSTEVRDALLSLGVGRPDQYQVIPLGFELEPFLSVAGRSGDLRRQLGVGSDTLLVGALGRFAPIKDFVTLVGSVALVPDAHLVILGDGPERPSIIAAATRHGIVDRLHLPGWCEDVPAAMADLDVVALTSRNEGTPVSLIEAQACGIPTVATAVGGVAAVVRDGRTGFLVPAGDVSGMAARLKLLLGDAPLRRRLGTEGRAWVVERFGHERLVGEIGNVYDNLVSGRRPEAS